MSVRAVCLIRSAVALVLLLIFGFYSRQQGRTTQARLQAVREKAVTAVNIATSTGVLSMNRALEPEEQLHQMNR